MALHGLMDHIANVRKCLSKWKLSFVSNSIKSKSYQKSHGRSK